MRRRRPGGVEQACTYSHSHTQSWDVRDSPVLRRLPAWCPCVSGFPSTGLVVCSHYLSFRVSVCPSVCPCLSVRPCVCVYQHWYSDDYLPGALVLAASLQQVHMSVRLSVSSSVYPSVCASVCASMFLSFLSLPLSHNLSLSLFLMFTNTQNTHTRWGRGMA